MSKRPEQLTLTRHMERLIDALTANASRFDYARFQFFHSEYVEEVLTGIVIIRDGQMALDTGFEFSDRR